MTKVKFINEYYFFEYQTSRGEPQRFHYYLHAAFCRFLPTMTSSHTGQRVFAEKTVFSSDFLPERAFSRRYLP